MCLVRVQFLLQPQVKGVQLIIELFTKLYLTPVQRNEVRTRCKCSRRSVFGTEISVGLSVCGRFIVVFSLRWWEMR